MATKRLSNWKKNSIGLCRRNCLKQCVASSNRRPGKQPAIGSTSLTTEQGSDGDDDNNIRPNQPKACTTRFHSYATLAVNRKGKRVTLAITMVHKGEKMDQIVKRLIARARQLGARFKCTYWDKAFGAVEVMRYLRACRVPYIIALAQHGKNGIPRLG